MKGILALMLVCLVLAICPLSGCNQSQSSDVRATFDQLFSNPGGYSNKEITIEGYFFQGFEIIVLCEKLEYSGYAADHLIPRGRMIWVEGGIPKEIYDALMQQQMMGPAERYGKLSIKGKFEYGGQYGHLGGFNSQIVPAEVKLLAWSNRGEQ